MNAITLSAYGSASRFQLNVGFVRQLAATDLMVQAARTKRTAALHYSHGISASVMAPTTGGPSVWPMPKEVMAAIAVGQPAGGYLPE